MGEHLKKLEHLADSILSTLSESLLVLDHQLRVLGANRAFYQTFHVQPDQVHGRFLKDLGDGQWDIGSLLQTLEALLNGGSELEGHVVEHNFPEIGYRVMRLNARLVAQAAELPPLILLAISDITEEHRLRTLQEAHLRKLEWSNRELEDFAHVASHDLQEPLRAIQAFSDRLANKYGPDLDEQGQDYLRRIQRASGRMRVLITDLLAYSRVSVQGKPYVRVPLGEVVKEALADLSVQIAETGATITVEPLPTIDADPVQMRQLIQNLVGNALKFARPGVAPVITIRQEESPRSIVAVPGPSCLITVRDNGIGFDEKHAERIFAPFERLHNPTQYPGTGIGLAVCRRIIQRHNGEIFVRSSPGGGTTFSLHLPLHQPGKNQENI